MQLLQTSFINFINKCKCGFCLLQEMTTATVASPLATEALQETMLANNFHNLTTHVNVFFLAGHDYSCSTIGY